MSKPIDKIPKGSYCYTISKTPCKENNNVIEIDCCPYWEAKEGYPDQECGYCHYLEIGDMDEKGTSLLWDQVKECGINEDNEYYEEYIMDRRSIGNTIMLQEVTQDSVSVRGDIFIPEIVKDKSTRYWKVVGLGTGCKDENGVVPPFKVKVGELLIVDIKNNAPTTVTWEGEKIVIINQTAIIAKVEENDTEK